MPIETTLTVSDRLPENAELTAVPFGPDLAASPVELPVPVSALLSHYEAKGEPGEVFEVPVVRGDGVGRVLLYGTGDCSAPALRKAGAAIARKAKGRPSLSVVVPAHGDVSALVEGALLASYTFRIGQTRTSAVEEIVFSGADEPALRRGEVAARATALARDLVNTPADVKTPEWLAEQARIIAADHGLAVRVWADGDLGEFGGIRAVGQGSIHPPRFVQLQYTPENAGDGTPHVVLAGKGITFDTGGLSLKPNEGMKTMKTDMAGGAVVMAVMSALAAFEVPVRVTGLIACAENAISGSAQRPSDVITQYGGRTVEVLNTDAEGRLVLADALAYADAELDPDVMIDIATLTGAAKVALGVSLGALYATDESVADSLLSAGEISGDRFWRMPLLEDYRADLDSDVADLTNVDRKMSGAAGSVIAALYLREFVGERPWAHLDIAGPARSAADDGQFTKGATGFGVRMLLSYLAA
ncbi:leucyl aminopeptidase [Planotetraspora silvatica]|uniref:Probable cytosol aminopeptidase n=1 Tax=Planotetraspora silvatica TaxID=234614 RepID=A0A8J3XLB0_9ACTN|nr:leucyl aminopeptidase [Planotetraspora silvatica]GII45364.1 leucyl aminopeptidase [Planotetraspora silvatica]